MIEEKFIWGEGVSLPDLAIVRESYHYAKTFLNEFAQMGGKKFELYPGCQPPGCSPNDIIEFLDSNGFVFVPVTIGDNDFVSWLIPLPPNGKNTHIYVAIDLAQVHKWREKTGMPANIQLNRIVIHEFAHKILHRGLVATSLEAAGRRMASYSSPKEEEEAWVFTFMFFAFVMGEYSLISRKRVGVDHTPAHFI